MTHSRSGIGRYGVVVVGVTMLIGGVAAVGGFLAVAGRGFVAGALGLGGLTLVLFITGGALLRASAVRRGGVLVAAPTPAQQRRYHRTYRSSRSSAH